MIRLLLTSSLLAAASVAQTQHLSPKEAAARPVAGFAATWNRHDMRRFGQLFATDADFVNVTGSWWKGREAIEKNHAYLHGTIASTDTIMVTAPARNHGIFGTTVITFDSIHVRILAPAVAAARVPWTIRGDGRTAAERKGLFLFVVKKAQGQWYIAAAQHTEVNRPAELNK